MRITRASRSSIKRLDRIGVRRIADKLNDLSMLGKDVVLVCYEDIRKGKDDWCHRTAFAEWWQRKTGEIIEELYDPTTPKVKAPLQSQISPSKAVSPEENIPIQLSLF